jgi:hypothetical protein
LVKKVVLLGSPALVDSAFSLRLQTLVLMVAVVQVELVMIGLTLAVITDVFRLVVAVVVLEVVRRALVATWVAMVQVVQNGAAVTGSAIRRMRTGM